MTTPRTAPDPTAILSIFQALGDENRLRIIEDLQGGERCVCDLQTSLDLGQSLLSHHLRVLREAGLVRSRREGRWVHYTLSDDVLFETGEWIAGIGETARTALPRTSQC